MKQKRNHRPINKIITNIAVRARKCAIEHCYTTINTDDDSILKQRVQGKQTIINGGGSMWLKQLLYRMASPSSRDVTRKKHGPHSMLARSCKNPNDHVLLKMFLRDRLVLLKSRTNTK